MTLAISAPPNPGVIGPGVQLTITSTLTGPFPADDYITASVTDAATFLNTLTVGSRVQGGLYPFHLSIGYHDAPRVLSQFGAAPLNLYGTPLAFTTGQAVVISLLRLHANGTTAEGSAAIAGFNWDALTGLWLFELNRGGNTNALASAILAAVQSQFPSLP